MITQIFTFTAHPAVQVYIWIATALAITLMLRMPILVRTTPATFGHRADNVIGSIVAGVALGWLVWPLVVAAYLIKRRES